MRRLLCIIAWMLLALPASADKWALIIGIDDYEDRNHISSLSGAARDARQFQKTLIEIMGVDDSHIQLLVADKKRDGDESLPTRANISQALSRLKQSAKAGDTVYVFFSGHGIRVGTKDYLLPYDFKGLDAESGIDTAYEEDKFYERLAQVQAAAIILVWDKCRNDPFGKTRNGTPQRNTLTDSQVLKSWNVVRSADDPPLPTLIKLFACSPGQCSYEWTDKGQGYFTYFLERGLRGAAADSNGQITVKSLKDYLLKEVSTRVKQNENAQQTPHTTLDGTNPEDLVLAVPGKVAAIAPEPARPNPKPAPKTSTAPANTVKKTPPTNPATPLDTNMPLSQRVLKAHRWDTFQTLSSVRYTGMVKTSGTELDPETWSGYTMTMTPSGKFQGSWKSSDGGTQQEVSGDPQNLIVKIDGQTVYSPPDENLKTTAFPQGIIATTLHAVQAGPADWKPTTDPLGPALTATQSDGTVTMTLIAIFDSKTMLMKRLKVSVGAVGVIVRRYQYDLSDYQTVQGVPLPKSLQVEIVNIADKTTERAIHTYSSIGINK